MQQFRAAIDYIAEDSVQNAEKVRLEIIDKINQLAITPEIHSPDKFKIDNDGNYRALESVEE